MRMPFLTVCLRLMLVFSLWQSPLPRPDYHCGAPQTLNDRQHFSTFHALGDLRNPDLGWHFHAFWPNRRQPNRPLQWPSSSDPADSENCESNLELDAGLPSPARGWTHLRQVETAGSAATLDLYSKLTSGDVSIRVAAWVGIRMLERAVPTSRDLCARLCTWQF